MNLEQIKAQISDYDLMVENYSVFLSICGFDIERYIF